MITAESDNLQRLSVEKAEFVDAFFMNSKANLEVRRERGDDPQRKMIGNTIVPFTYYYCREHVYTWRIYYVVRLL